MPETDFFAWWLLSPLGRVVAGIWGALWGSFFNVMIVRVPSEESVVRPASHCRACGAPIHWYDNIPILSYLVLLGRCRRCRTPYSARYLLVEVLVCALAVLLHHTLVMTGDGPLSVRAGQFVIASLFCGTLVAITFIDIDLLKIPDLITYPAIPLCVLLSLFMELPHLWDGLVGAVAGYLIIRLIADGYQLLTGRLGMGYGDAKLLAMIGGLMGWQVLLPTLFLASLQGSVIGISGLLIARRMGRGADGAPDDPQERGEQERDDAAAPREETTPATSAPPLANSDAPCREQIPAHQPDEGVEEDDEEDLPPGASLRHARIPFGPFLSLAAIELLVLRDHLPALFPYLYF